MPGTAKTSVKARSRSVPKERTTYVSPQASGKLTLNLNSLQKNKPAESRNKMQKAAPRSGSPFSTVSLGDHYDLDGAISPQESRRESRRESQRESQRDSCRVSEPSYRGGSLGEEKCICHICTCGKHHCPKKHAYNPTPFEGSTSYGNTFKGHDSAHFPERARAPTSLYAGTRVPASHFTTTHGSTYIEHENDHYTKPHAEAAMQKSIRPARQAPRERFDHTSTQKNDYPWHDTPVQQRSASPSLSHTPFGSGNMDFGTTYGNHFVGTSTRPASPSIRPTATYSYGSPRDFSTTNKTHFDGKQHPICPASILPSKVASARSGHVKYQIDISTGTWN